MTNQSPQTEEVPEEILQWISDAPKKMYSTDTDRQTAFEKIWSTGAIAMYHHLQDKPIMNWLKASKQMPDDLKRSETVTVYGREVYAKVGILKVHGQFFYYQGIYYFQYVHLTGHGTKIESEFDEIEWLFEPQTK